MKNIYFIFSVLALATTCFVGCNRKPDLSNVQFQIDNQGKETIVGFTGSVPDNSKPGVGTIKFPKRITSATKKIDQRKFIGLELLGMGERVEVLAAVSEDGEYFDVFVDTTFSVRVIGQLILPSGDVVVVQRHVPAGSHRFKLPDERDVHLTQ